MTNETRVELRENFFTEREHLLADHGGLKVSIFRYETSVAAVRIANRRGEIVVLPYQGQQIWRCRFDGRELTMKSIFDEPEPTRDYLGTYGGFFLHCGATAFGVPTAADTHPLHGELPNAPYREAFIACGGDERGRWVGIGGRYEHKKAFNHRYLAEPFIKIREDSAVPDFSMSVTNLLNAEADIMYLAHINFRPVDHSELCYTADYGAEHVRVNVNVPKHIKTSAPIETFTAFLRELKENPALHHRIDPKHLYDPEVVIEIDYKADADGTAHTMQLRPDGYADYVAHKPAQLDRALRWIARSPDQDALGLVLPANSGNGGYLAEKAAGNVKTLAAGGRALFEIKAGLLNPEEAAEMKKKIDSVRP